MKILPVLLFLSACGGGSELVVKEEAPLFNPPSGIASKYTVDYFTPEKMKIVVAKEAAFRAAMAASAGASAASSSAR